ncbi:hypothetical protein PT974_12308 [Cladobotryum mycophilum]|uniref:F-box domain-containing protein n=1 Tax=Cladobotryum mycophilum TaxID=491253 RepID=A0ABR0S7R8_9HYPO
MATSSLFGTVSPERPTIARTRPGHKSGASRSSVRHSMKTGGREKATFLNLPTEIHLAISEMLIYPDALSLKYANRYFHNLVDTGINLKVQWLVERRRLHLECPNEKRCDLGTDLRFCRGSVALLMKRRREHIECESLPGLGCIIYGTPTCPNRRKGVAAWKRWLETKMTIELRWLLLAMALFVGSWLYMVL